MVEFSGDIIKELIYHCPRCLGDWYFIHPPKWKYTTQHPEENRPCPQCKIKAIVQGKMEKWL